MQKKYLSALWWEMPQFNGWAQISRLWHFFTYVLDQFRKATSRARFFQSNAKNYIYFSALWWAMPQFYGWTPILRHHRNFSCVLRKFRKAASRVRFFRSHAKIIFLDIWWCCSNTCRSNLDLRHSKYINYSKLASMFISIKTQGVWVLTFCLSNSFLFTNRFRTTTSIFPKFSDLRTGF